MIYECNCFLELAAKNGISDVYDFEAWLVNRQDVNWTMFDGVAKFCISGSVGQVFDDYKKYTRSNI